MMHLTLKNCVSQVSKKNIIQGVYLVTCFLLFLSSEKLATGKVQTEPESVLLASQTLIRMIKGQTVLIPHMPLNAQFRLARRC